MSLPGSGWLHFPATKLIGGIVSNYVMAFWEYSQNLCSTVCAAPINNTLWINNTVLKCIRRCFFFSEGRTQGLWWWWVKFINPWDESASVCSTRVACSWFSLISLRLSDSICTILALKKSFIAKETLIWIDARKLVWEVYRHLRHS